MGELAARTIFSNDTGPLAGTGLDTLAKNQGAILELEGAQAPQSKTITDGSISPTAAYVIVDTEGSAAADDLDVINPVLSASENLHDGMVVYLKAADSGRVVTVKNSSSANGINTYDGNDYVLSTTHWLKLQLRSGKWYEVEGRAMETALAAAQSAAEAEAVSGGLVPRMDAVEAQNTQQDTALSGKANTDLSNLTMTGKQTTVGLLKKKTAIALSFPWGGGNLAALPADGWLTFKVTGGGGVDTSIEMDAGGVGQSSRGNTGITTVEATIWAYKGATPYINASPWSGQIFSVTLYTVEGS